eukprot:923231-Heterocapsa_arctica.AAC.1
MHRIGRHYLYNATCLTRATWCYTICVHSTLAPNDTFKVRICAKSSARCEDFDGDNENARI